MSKQPLRLYEFGPFRLNVTERLLQRSNEAVPLTPKVIDTLVLLVENSGHVLGKDELMRELWPDSFVEESSLTQNISLLRKALGESGHGQQYIETIPKRGYRFVAGVREVAKRETELVMQERTSTHILIEEEQPDADADISYAIAKRAHNFDSPTTPNSKLRYGLLAAVLLLISAIAAFYYGFPRQRTTVGGLSAKSIAVLPFKTVGAGNDTDVLGLGMADAIILRLSRQSQRTVLPTSSIFKYTGRDADALSAGRDLGVDAVLEGTLQRDGDRVRVTAQLITLNDGKAVWSGKFEEDYRSVFTLQDSIAEKLTTALQPQVIGDTTSPAKHPTENAEAYQAYLMGLHFWTTRTKENLSKAIDYFEQAVSKDPSFALAYAKLADCYYLGSQPAYAIFNMEESSKRADAAATRALQLDDLVPEAHTVKAGILWSKMDYDQADREFQRALQLNPNHATGHLRYAYFLFGNSQLKEAVDHMKLAQELDPVSPISNTALGYILSMSRDNDGAITHYKKALELQPETVVARFNLGLIYADQRRFDMALAEFEKLRNSDPTFALQGKAYAYALSGRRDEAKAAISQLQRSKDGNRIGRYDYAVLYAALGDKDIAFQYLEGISPTRFNMARLRTDPELDSLRTDVRFDERVRDIDRIRSQNETQRYKS
jgi:DNA-binding winged helix-turn-helix (wHTH) protein/TolB-like protein/Tfp pilus assembly protein PilF